MSKKRSTDLDVTPDGIEYLVRVVRGQRVMLDFDLARLYGVATSALNQAVQRNVDRFPEDFAYQLTQQEFASLMSQSVISKPGRGGRRKLPWAFTEHGVAMLSSVLRRETMRGEKGMGTSHPHPAAEMSTTYLIDPSARRRYHRLMLLVSCGVIAASLVFEVRPDQKVVLPWLPGLPLPASCLSKTLFHVDCPGCGLTRSFIHLAHGRFAQSITLHRLGWLLALTVLLQLPYRAFAMFSPRAEPLGRRFPQWLGMALIALLIANWAVNLVLGIQTPLVESGF